MRVSREQMAANHAGILEEASRQFRERGFDAVTVADVMKGAGLTHGGFYGHFASKDDLIAKVLAHLLSHGEGPIDDLAEWQKAYLSPAHRDDPALGCAVGSLAGLMGQQTPQARAAMATGIEGQLARLADAIDGSDGDRRRAAIGQWSAMVGALVLSRAVGDASLSRELLDETRAWLDQQNRPQNSAM